MTAGLAEIVVVVVDAVVVVITGVVFEATQAVG